MNSKIKPLNILQLLSGHYNNFDGRHFFFIYLFPIIRIILCYSFIHYDNCIIIYLNSYYGITNNLKKHIVYVLRIISSYQTCSIKYK
jgi:hypothetical protein